MLTKISRSTEATRELAKHIADKLKGGEVLALVGELGAGKTTFAKGLAEYFGIESTVTSPTFTLVQEYAVRGPKLKAQSSKQIQNPKSKKLSTASYRLPVTSITHIDCYRLNSPQELLEIGFKDYLTRQDTVIIIEWADKVKNILPPNTQWLNFKHGKKENERVIVLN